jgi:hypothetical protein
MDVIFRLARSWMYKKCMTTCRVPPEPRANADGLMASGVGDDDGALLALSDGWPPWDHACRHGGTGDTETIYHIVAGDVRVFGQGPVKQCLGADGQAGGGWLAEARWLAQRASSACRAACAARSDRTAPGVNRGRVLERANSQLASVATGILGVRPGELAAWVAGHADPRPWPSWPRAPAA